MKKRMILFAVAATMSLVSCVNDILNVEENQAETPKVHLTFSASYNDDTKTQLVNGTDVWWNPYDVISVNGEYFCSTNEEPSPSADFEGEIAPEADEITVKLQKAILALPIKQRLVFNMRYYDELPFEAISQITGDSVSTLKTNYHYAAKRVKQIVSQLEYE